MNPIVTVEMKMRVAALLIRMTEIIIRVILVETIQAGKIRMKIVRCAIIQQAGIKTHVTVREDKEIPAIATTGMKIITAHAILHPRVQIILPAGKETHAAVREDIKRMIAAHIILWQEIEVNPKIKVADVMAAI